MNTLLKSFFFITASTMAMSTQAAILVEFDASVNNFNPGPLPVTSPNTTFSGSFEIDDGVIPSSGGLKYFDNALDNVSVTVSGQTFGGTDGRFLQFTNGSATSGFMTGTLDNTGASVFGTYFDGINTWVLENISFDWRGAPADMFPSANPELIANDLTEFDFSYMKLAFNWYNQADGTISSDSLNMNISQVTFSEAVVPVPAALPLLLSALSGLGFLLRRKI